MGWFYFFIVVFVFIIISTESKIDKVLISILLVVYILVEFSLNENVREASTHGNTKHGWYSKENTIEKFLVKTWIFGYPIGLLFLAGYRYEKLEEQQKIANAVKNLSKKNMIQETKKLVSLVQKKHKNSDNVFNNIMDDLEEYQFEPDSQKSVILQMAYLYSQQAVNALFYINGSISKQTYSDYSARINKLKESETLTDDLCDESIQQAIEFFQSYNQRLNKKLIAFLIYAADNDFQFLKGLGEDLSTDMLLDAIEHEVNASQVVDVVKFYKKYGVRFYQS